INYFGRSSYFLPYHQWSSGFLAEQIIMSLKIQSIILLISPETPCCYNKRMHHCDTQKHVRNDNRKIVRHHVPLFLVASAPNSMFLNRMLLLIVTYDTVLPAITLAPLLLPYLPRYVLTGISFLLPVLVGDNKHFSGASLFLYNNHRRPTHFSLPHMPQPLVLPRFPPLCEVPIIC